MISANMISTPSRIRTSAGRLFGVAIGIFAVTACDGLFDVENPGALIDEDLEIPELESTLSNSAEGELAEPYSLSLVHGEMLGDHVWHPSVQDFALLIDAGYRDRDISVVEDMFNDLSAAVWVADDMVSRLQNMVDNPDAHEGIARSHFFGALGRMTLAAYFEDVVYDGGEPITPAQAIADARDGYLTAASIAGAAGEQNLQAAALGGAARAARSLYYEGEVYGGGGDPSDMEDAETFARQALDISSSFLVNVRYGQPGAVNGMYNSLTIGPYHRMTPDYADRTDPVGGETDPRIEHAGTQTPGPRGEVRYLQDKYPELTSPLPASRAAEAELIIAEARYLAGDMDGTVEFINRVRARSELPAFSGTDPDAVWEQLQYERDTELWLEGRRWEDHRYYDIIPKYWIQRNRDVGTKVRWPMSVQERFNNPSIAGGG